MMSNAPSLWLVTMPLPDARSKATESVALCEASSFRDQAVLAVLQRDLDGAAFCDLLLGIEEELDCRMRALEQRTAEPTTVHDNLRALWSLATGFGFEALANAARTALSIEIRRPDFPCLLASCIDEARCTRSHVAVMIRASTGMPVRR